MVKYASTIAICAFLLSGCATDLRVSPLRPESASGIAYNLPFTQFTVTSKWTVTSCTPTMDVTVKVEAVAGSAEDGSHSYVIDPGSIQTATNVASLKVTYQNGTNLIDSINESAEDQTGTVISNVATGVAKIALAVIGAPVPDPHAAPSEAPPVCSQKTSEALKNSKALTAQLKALTDRVSDATDRVKLLAAKATQMGPAVDDATKKALGDAIDTLNDLTAQQTDLTNQLSDAQKPLTFSLTEYWPKDVKTFSANPGMQLPSMVVAKWTDQPVSGLSGSTVYFAIERTGSFGRDPARPGDAGEPPESYKGIRYWIPAQGRMVACDQNPCTSTDPAHVLVKVDTRISQLGYIGILPVHTRPFGSSTFAASFDSSGGLKSAGYEQKTAPAVGISSAFSSSASAVSPIITALGPTATLNRQADELAAEKKVKDSITALQADPNAATSLAAKALDADTALINARIANLQAQATLTALQAAQAK